jgi:hypothetical protein
MILSSIDTLPPGKLPRPCRRAAPYYVDPLRSLDEDPVNDIDVTPLRSLSDDQALAWLRDQPDSRTPAGPAELGRRWGWSRHAVSRRITTWQKRGLVTRARDGALVAAPDTRAPAQQTEPRAPLARVGAHSRGAGQLIDTLEEKPRHAPAPSPDAARAFVSSPAPDSSDSVAARAVPALSSELSLAPPIAHATVLPAEQRTAKPMIATMRAIFLRQTGTQRTRPSIDRMAILAVGGAGILACFSTALCILGFATMFPAMPRLAMAMAAGIEFVRLIAIGFAGRCWRDIGLVLKPLLLLLIVAAEAVSIVSVYSQLTAIHNGSRPVDAAKRDLVRATLQARQERQQAIVDGLDQRLTQIDRLTADLVGAASNRGKINGAQDVIARQAKERAAVEQERRQAADVLTGLKTDSAAIVVTTVLAEAEVAGVKQLARLFSGSLDDETATRCWIAAITLLLGPFAAILTAAAASSRKAI